MRIILKRNLKNMRCELHSYASELWPEADCCKYCYGPLDVTKGERFLEFVRSYQILKDYPVDLESYTILRILLSISKDISLMLLHTLLFLAHCFTTNRHAYCTEMCISVLTNILHGIFFMYAVSNTAEMGEFEAVWDKVKMPQCVLVTCTEMGH
jgi:hypothetical protein